MDIPRRYWNFIGFVIAILILRLPFVTIDFFCVDEPYSVTMGNIASNGGIYGVDFACARGPLIYYTFALITKAFGYGNMVAVRIVHMIYIFICTLLVSGLSRSLGSKNTGILAGLLFIIFSFAYQGDEFWAFNLEFVLLPFLLGGIWMFWSAQVDHKSWKLMLSGLLIGVACTGRLTVSASGIVFLIFILMDVCDNRSKLREGITKSLLLAAGYLFGILLLFIPNILTGTLSQGTYSFFIYPLTYYSSISNVNFFGRLLLITKTQQILWILSLLYVIQSVTLRYRTYNVFGANADTYLILQAVAQFIGIYINGKGYGHYFLLVIPLLGIMTSLFCEHLVGMLNKDIKIGIGRATRNVSSSIMAFPQYLSWFRGGSLVCISLLMGSLISVSLSFAFPEDNYAKDGSTSIISFFHEKKTRFHPFKVAAKQIKTMTDPNDAVLVWGKCAELYPLSKRLPYLPWTSFDISSRTDPDTLLYNWYYKPWRDSISNNPPRVIVVPSGSYDGKDVNSEKWFKTMLDEEYVLKSHITWDKRSKFFRGSYMKGEEWIDLYERKDNL